MADTQVAEAKSTAVANIMDDLFDSAGQGMDQIGVEDMQIPFLRLLQPLSPQLLKTDAKYIKGALSLVQPSWCSTAWQPSSVSSSCHRSSVW